MLSVSQRAARIVQAGIRAMSIECERANGINLAQGVCDTGVPAAERRAVERGIERGINSYSRFDGLGEAAPSVERTSSASASPSETTSWRKRADDWRTLA